MLETDGVGFAGYAAGGRCRAVGEHRRRGRVLSPHPHT
jgi:hypothetical protein